MESLAELVSGLRNRTGITQAELAERSGVSRLTVLNIENGERRPTTDVLRGLAVGFAKHPLTGEVDQSLRKSLFLHFMVAAGHLTEEEAGSSSSGNRDEHRRTSPDTDAKALTVKTEPRSRELVGAR